MAPFERHRCLGGRTINVEVGRRRDERGGRQRSGVDGDWDTPPRPCRSDVPLHAYVVVGPNRSSNTVGRVQRGCRPRSRHGVFPGDSTVACYDRRWYPSVRPGSRASRFGNRVPVSVNTPSMAPDRCSTSPAMDIVDGPDAGNDPVLFDDGIIKEGRRCPLTCRNW